MLDGERQPVCLLSTKCPLMDCMQVLRQLLPKPPLYVRFGGSIPATGYFKEYLGIETSMFAWGLGDNRVHAPNER